MSEAQKASAVSLIETQSWLLTNKNRTWHISTFNVPMTRDFKYLEISIDTRFMHVWRLKTDRGVEASISEDFEGNILQLLEKKLDS